MDVDGDRNLANFIKEAINRSDYVQKVITHLKQEQPAYIKSEYSHLKRLCFQYVDELIEANKIKFERVKSRSPNRLPRLQKRPTMIPVITSPTSPPMELPFKLPKLEKDVSSLIPSINFSDIAISEDNLNLIKRVMSYLRHNHLFKNSILAPCIGAMVTGFPGSGKTTLIEAIAGVFSTFSQEYKIPLVKRSAIDLFTDFKSTSEEKKFEEVILLIDDIDIILASHQELNSNTRVEERKFIGQLCQCLDDTSKSHPRIIVFTTTSNASMVDTSLRRTGRFEYEISISMPNEATRYEMLKVITKQFELSECVDLRIISRHTPGYVASDLVALVREATLISYDNQSNVHGNNDAVIILEGGSKLRLYQQYLMDAIKYVKPLSTKEGFSTFHDVVWEDVGGMENVKNYLKLSIAGPILHPKVFDSLGLHASTGILLAGPPGCGKTLVAKAVANVDGLNFISVKGPELISSYVGESEKAIRNLFARAQIAEPCVIFFDEIDSICSKRSDDPNVFNQLLTEMDGILKRNRVFIIGATNRPDMIDPAVLRKGRFDRIFYVGLPSHHEKISILRTLSKNGTKPKFSDDSLFDKIASDSRFTSFSGADIASLIREASLFAFQEFCSKVQSDEEIVLTMEHFDVAFNNVKPSLSQQDLQYYESFNHSR